MADMGSARLSEVTLTSLAQQQFLSADDLNCLDKSATIWSTYSLSQQIPRTHAREQPLSIPHLQRTCKPSPQIIDGTCMADLNYMQQTSAVVQKRRQTANSYDRARMQTCSCLQYLNQFATAYTASLLRRLQHLLCAPVSGALHPAISSHQVTLSSALHMFQTLAAIAAADKLKMPTTWTPQNIWYYFGSALVSAAWRLRPHSRIQASQDMRSFALYQAGPPAPPSPVHRLRYTSCGR